MPYPTSLMGSIALLDKAFMMPSGMKDMDKGFLKTESEALANQWKQNNHELGSYKNLGIAIELSKEFQIPFIIKGDGLEYKTINLLKESRQLFLPLVTQKNQA